MSVQIDKVLEEVAPKTHWYVVIRPFEGDGGQYVAGEVVDTSGWRYTKRLTDMRYISALPHGVAVPDVAVGSDGKERRILDGMKTAEEENVATPRPKAGRSGSTRKAD